MISALVVNRNGGDLLLRALRSADDEPEVTEIVLVDNASTDDSVDRVRAELPDVRVVEPGANLGFGRANNLAASEANGEALLLLNPDAWLTNGAVAALSGALTTSDRRGLVAPRLVYPDGGRQFGWGPARSVLGEAFQKAINRWEGATVTHERAVRSMARLLGPIWYSGACLLLRAEAFRGVGGFDERYFMYFEDVDLCARLRAAGWNLHEARDAEVVHAKGMSTSAPRDDLYRPSQLLFYQTHRPAWELGVLERRLRRRYGGPALERWRTATEGPPRYS